MVIEKIVSTESADRTLRLRIVLAYIALVLIWGSTWMAIKIQLQYAPPLASVGFRYIVAGSIVFFICRGWSIFAGPVRWKLLLVMSTFLFGVNYLLNYVAEMRVASGLTAVLFGTLPFFVIAFGRLFGREPATRMTLLGAIIAFVGVVIVSVGQGLHGAFYYSLAAVGAAMAAGFGQVYVKRFSAGEAISMMPSAMLISGFAISSVAWVVQRPDLAALTNPVSLCALAYLSLVGTAVAFSLNFWLLRQIKASAVSMFALLAPIVALIIGWLSGHENTFSRDLVGVAFILCGAAAALFGSRENAKKLQGTREDTVEHAPLRGSPVTSANVLPMADET